MRRVLTMSGCSPSRGPLYLCRPDGTCLTRTKEPPSVLPTAISTSASFITVRADGAVQSPVAGLSLPLPAQHRDGPTWPSLFHYSRCYAAEISHQSRCYAARVFH